MKQFEFTALPRVNPSSLLCSAAIRNSVDFFQVDEQLPFEPDGTGGHVWLKIRKRNINTVWLANELAKFAKVSTVDVGYAGLKDRHAITSQWFSVNFEGHDEPADWSAFETDDIQIVKTTRHGKKLKRGVLAGNHFKLRLTHVQGDRTVWEQNLKQIQQYGVPNYFAEQRFGYNGSNLYRVEHWFATGKAPRKRNQKSIYLSAARSWLFNLVLAERIYQHNWNKVLTGDVMLLAGTKSSFFTVDNIDNELHNRIQMMDIHPTGVMWGRGLQQTHADSLQLEQQALTDWQDWQQGLEKAGLNQERRSLRLVARDFVWHFLSDHALELSFFLPAGSYATAVIKELAVISDVQRRNSQASYAIQQNGD